MKTRKSIHQYLQELIEYKTDRKKRFERKLKSKACNNESWLIQSVLRLKDDIQELKHLVGHEGD